MYILHVFVLYLFGKTNLNNRVPSSKWNVYNHWNIYVSVVKFQSRSAIKFQSRNVMNFLGRKPECFKMLPWQRREGENKEVTAQHLNFNHCHYYCLCAVVLSSLSALPGSAIFTLYWRCNEIDSSVQTLIISPWMRRKK